MIFNSVDYLFFFPIVLLVYFVIPKRFRYIWLLVASYFFYMCWNAKYVLLILITTLSTYFGALFLDKKRDDKESKKRLAITIVVAINIALLFYFKYLNFMLMSLSDLLSIININLSIPKFDILLPVGISFFTFQSIGYLIDVYRHDIKAERNILRYALFVSFFPQLVAGPIERSKNLLTQLYKANDFAYDRARYGLLTIAYGLFLKMVIADRIAIIIDPIFDNPVEYTGPTLLVAAVLFSFQIYCDFNGYTKIAIGSAKVLGYELRINFNQPYLASSVSDFWRRWHISLTSWFRDYVYIPLGGNRKGKVRKYINTMIVFLLSGLWHGASWHFVVWGGLNGTFLVAEDKFGINKRIKEKSVSVFSLFYRSFSFLAVVLTWIFFRANSLYDAFYILKSIPTKLGGFNGVFGTDKEKLFIALLIIILLVFDILKEKNKDVISWILKRNVFIRWGIYFLIVAILMYFGIYGNEYEQTAFIYFQF